MKEFTVSNKKKKKKYQQFILGISNGKPYFQTLNTILQFVKNNKKVRFNVWQELDLRG